MNLSQLQVLDGCHALVAPDGIGLCVLRKVRPPTPSVQLCLFQSDAALASVGRETLSA